MRCVIGSGKYSVFIKYFTEVNLLQKINLHYVHYEKERDIKMAKAATTPADEKIKNVTEESAERTFEEAIEAAVAESVEEELQEYDEDVYVAPTDEDEGSKELVIPIEPQSARNRRVETVDSDRARRRLYNNGVVFDEDEGKVRLNANNSERHKEFLELIASAKSANVKKGTVVGVETSENTGQVCVSINYGKHFEVKIPVEQLVDFSLQPPENQKAIISGGDAKERCLRKIASAMEGAEVSYRVTGLSEGAGVAFGDHLEALSRKGRQHYATLRRDGKPDVTVGMKVRAKVMAVNMIGMWVEAAGAQAFIRADEISWNRSGDITQIYSPGDTVMVLIQDIRSKSISYKINNKEKTVNVVEVDASVKRCESNPNKVYFNKFDLGSRGTAEVVQITPDGIFVVYREKVTVLLSFPETGDNPDIGDKVSIMIDRKIHNADTEEYLFYGKLIRIIRKS